MYSLKSMRASPQIIAQRNPKAQKAGGLCLALKGVPVKPTDDEVDATKEYQLVSYGDQ